MQENQSIKLTVGQKFKQSYLGNSGLIFEVLSINRPDNSLKVKVTDRQENSWEEDWDDLDITETSFEIGEYSVVK